MTPDEHLDRLKRAALDQADIRDRIVAQHNSQIDAAVNQNVLHRHAIETLPSIIRSKDFFA
jgi:hypothetical protein